jgi:hypothetical protein
MEIQSSIHQVWQCGGIVKTKHCKVRLVHEIVREDLVVALMAFGPCDSTLRRHHVLKGPHHGSCKGRRCFGIVIYPVNVLYSICCSRGGEKIENGTRLVQLVGKGPKGKRFKENSTLAPAKLLAKPLCYLELNILTVVEGVVSVITNIEAVLEPIFRVEEQAGQ